MTSPESNIPAVFRAGDRVFLVVSLDVMRDRVDARGTQVLEHRRDMLVVGQPEPVLPKTHLGKTLEVAVFPPSPPDAATCAQPLGYDARVLKFFPAFPAGAKGRTMPALGLTPPSGSWRPAIIRLHARARVQPENGLTVVVTGKDEADILDLSGGGALLSLPGRAGDKGRVLKFELVFPDGDRMALSGEVRWTAPDPSRQGRTLAGVRFKGLSVAESRHMARLAQQILSPCETTLKSLGREKTMPWPTTFKTHG